MLLPVVLLIVLILRLRGATESGGSLPFPWFLVVFAALIWANSTGLLPEPARIFLAEVSRWCLVTAIAALGMKTSLAALFHLGMRPVMLLVAETVFLGLLVLGLIALLGSH